MTEPRRGEVWWGEVEDLGRRPYLVMTRTPAIPSLRWVGVAPVTRSVRGISTELPLGPDDGLPTECVASFDNFTSILTAGLIERICVLDPVRMVAACEALRIAVDC